MSQEDDVLDRPLLSSMLRQHLTECGFTQRELASKSGVSPATLHRWLTGKSEQPYHRLGLLKIAAAMDLPKARTNRLLRSAGLPPLGLKPDSDDIVEPALMRHWFFPVQHNLPANLTSFVGRAEETNQITELLCEHDVRLVTLTGPGGSGKTRLALRVAGEVLDVFRDGVYFVSLSALSDADLVLPTIAEAVGLRDAADISPRVRLANWLKTRRVLLILDNLEHLRTSASDVASLLREAPLLKILATSRVHLHVSGEHEWRVQPLPVPRPDVPRRTLMQNSAIELFVERARAANHRYFSDDAELQAVALVCSRLDGLPLAIELAAARIRDDDAADLLASFPSPLDLTSAGPRDLPQRQQTLRDTIAWSVDLLPESAKHLLFQLTVFAGGWTADAAAAVCLVGPASEFDLQRDLDILSVANLIERVSSENTVPRYRMLETIREYGYEQRRAEDDRGLHLRHARYFLRLAESAPPHVPESRIGDWYERVETDVDNIRAALSWVAEDRDSLILARFIVALWPYWHEYSRAQEGQRWVDTVLKHQNGLAVELRAALLTAACTFAATRTDYAAAHRYGQDAIALWRQLDGHRGRALVCRQLGWASYMGGDIESAIEMFNTAYDSWVIVGDERGIACGLSDLGMVVSIVGEADQAERFLVEAERRYQRLDDAYGVARVSKDRGLNALLVGELEHAIPTLREAIARLRETGKTNLLPGAMFYLGTALGFAGCLDESIEFLQQSLRFHAEMGDMAHTSLTILGLAAIAHRRHDAVRAAMLCGAVDAMRRSHRIVFPPAVQKLYDREIKLVLDRIDESTFHQAFEYGTTMTTSEAIALARQDN